MKNKNCFECKFNNLGGVYFFGRCEKRKFKGSDEIPVERVDIGCYLFKTREKRKCKKKTK